MNYRFCIRRFLLLLLLVALLSGGCARQQPVVTIDSALTARRVLDQMPSEEIRRMRCDEFFKPAIMGRLRESTKVTCDPNILGWVIEPSAGASAATQAE